MIKSKWPIFEQDELDAVQDVLRSGCVNYWTGEQCKLFEREFALYHGCDYAISLANGTLALELALYALGITDGDEVIVPSRTFIATASAVVARGGIPIVADVDANSGNLTLETIEHVRSEKTKAIIPVHLAGFPCDMLEIMSYAGEHNLLVIEDCAQAHGAEYHGQKVGSFGHAAIFSFCQDKIMTTGGEGGMLLVKDESTWKKAWAYKDHGKNYDVAHGEFSMGFRWLHESFGSNYRMTEMQGAIGRKQLSKLPQWLECRRKNAALLSEGLSDISLVRFPILSDSCKNSYYKLYCYVQNEWLRQGWSRDRLIFELNELGVPCYSGSCSEIYLEKAFVKIGLQPKERYPVAKKLGETSLMFLVDHTISYESMQRMLQTIRKVLSKASELNFKKSIVVNQA